jgi:hypothetical protein
MKHRRPLPPAYGPTIVNNDENQPLRAVIIAAFALSRDELVAALAYGYAETDPDQDPNTLTAESVQEWIEGFLAAYNVLELDDATRAFQAGPDSWSPEKRARMDALAAAVDRVYPEVAP